MRDNIHTKKRLKQFLRLMLSEHQDWQVRAIEILYALQTVDEQREGRCLENNGRGYDRNDAIRFSIYSELVMTDNLERITPAAWNVISDRLPRYAGQVLEYIDDDSLIKHFDDYTGGICPYVANRDIINQKLRELVKGHPELQKVVEPPRAWYPESPDEVYQPTLPGL